MTMANKKFRPGYFEKFLVIDCETSSMFRNTLSPSSHDGKYCQAISWGIVVTDTKTYLPIEKYYFEIKWDGKSEWSKDAESIHGLSRTHLDKHGIDEEEFVAEFAAIIDKHFNVDKINDTSGVVYLAGNNVSTFDYHFLWDQLERHGFQDGDFHIKFGHRQIDVTSVALLLFSTYTSRETFEFLNLNRDEGQHNALEDALCSLKTLRKAHVLCKEFIHD